MCILCFYQINLSLTYSFSVTLLLIIQQFLVLSLYIDAMYFNTIYSEVFEGETTPYFSTSMEE
jgi:hypothetical protein